MHRVVDLLSSQFHSGAFLNGLHRFFELCRLLQKILGAIAQGRLVI